MFLIIQGDKALALIGSMRAGLSKLRKNGTANLCLQVPMKWTKYIYKETFSISVSVLSKVKLKYTLGHVLFQRNIFSAMYVIFINRVFSQIKL